MFFWGPRSVPPRLQAAAAEATEEEEVDDEPVLLKPHELAAARMAALAEDLQQVLFDNLTEEFEASPPGIARYRDGNAPHMEATRYEPTCNFRRP